jgi:hypothetical protein
MEKGETKDKMEGILRMMEECALQDGDWEDRLCWRSGVERHCHIHTSPLSSSCLKERPEQPASCPHTCAS